MVYKYMEDTQPSLDDIIKDIDENMQELDEILSEKRLSSKASQDILFEDYEFDPMSL